MDAPTPGRFSTAAKEDESGGGTGGVFLPHPVQPSTRAKRTIIIVTNLPMDFPIGSLLADFKKPTQKPLW
jgi:hypothetical protein